MITEDYVSFETAKLLKEKGFNEPVNEFYNCEGKRGSSTSYNWNCTEGEYEDYSYISQSLAMKWLREVYGIHIFTEPVVKSETVVGYNFGITPVKCELVIKNVPISNAKSHEEACEAAIKYCLENLI